MNDKTSDTEENEILGLIRYCSFYPIRDSDFSHMIKLKERIKNLNDEQSELHSLWEKFWAEMVAFKLEGKTQV